MSRQIRLLSGFFTVGGWTLISRVLGFTRDIMIAAFLGSGPVAEAFLIAFSLPNMFRRFFGEGAFNTAFIPLFSKKVEGGEAATAFHHVYLEGSEGRMEIRPFDDPGAQYRRHGDDAWTLIPPYVDPTIPPLPEGIPPLPDNRPGWDRDPATEAYPFRLELLELVRCVEEGRDHRASGERGQASFEAVLGLYESARQQSLVRLPLV